MQPLTHQFVHRTDQELEAFLLFCIAVAGKSAASTEKAFGKLWIALRNRFPFTRMDPEVGPFELILTAEASGFFTGELLKDCGFGCYNRRRSSFFLAAGWFKNGANLRKITDPKDLEEIPGIGMKTSRFFLLHSQENARVAAIDTHIMKYMSHWFSDLAQWLELKGESPSSDAVKSAINHALYCRSNRAPLNKKHYLFLEQQFLMACDTEGKTPRQLDLEIWMKYTKSDIKALGLGEQNNEKTV